MGIHKLLSGLRGLSTINGLGTIRAARIHPIGMIIKSITQSCTIRDLPDMGNEQHTCGQAEKREVWLAILFC